MVATQNSKWANLSKNILKASAFSMPFLLIAAAPANANTMSIDDNVDNIATNADAPVRIWNEDASDSKFSNEKDQSSLFAETSTEFRELFNDWKEDENFALEKVFIPSGMPVENVRLTSQYGYREDPFRGRRARHKGIDLAGPIGTPIVATADGIVGRSQWVNGYGRYIEINHGGDIQTRYGHMSKLLVGPNEYVKKGQVIGLLGSSGRSTGPHLHYEVRISGQAMNPMPFIRSSKYLLAMNEDDNAQGGPEDIIEDDHSDHDHSE